MSEEQKIDKKISFSTPPFGRIIGVLLIVLYSVFFHSR